MNRPREDGKLFFLLDYFYQCWPDGPLGAYADFDFHCLSFHLHLIFTRMTVQVTYTFIPIVSHKDSFCHRGKRKLAIGLFIHELLREPLIYDSVLYARHFLPVKFFPEYYFYKLCFELPQNVTWTDE